MRVKIGASDRSFGIIIALALIFFTLTPLFSGRIIRWFLLPPAGALLLLAWLRPHWLHLPAKLWLKFGLLLSKITTPIIMAIIFYGLFSTVGILMRLFGTDPMRRKWEQTATSYWLKREEKFSRESMRWQF